eukprot:1252796-Alexandrium_andersonii.AAC.1
MREPSSPAGAPRPPPAPRSRRAKPRARARCGGPPRSSAQTLDGRVPPRLAASPASAANFGSPAKVVPRHVLGVVVVLEVDPAQE